MSKSTDEQILAKLDQILRVISIQVGADKSLTERVRLLKLAGLENRVIAEVLNISRTVVATLLYESRRTVKPRKRNR